MTIDSFVYPGVRRTACATYSGHCQLVVTKATRVAGMIRRAFSSVAYALRWPVFQAYVIMPIIMHSSQAWHPKLKPDVLLLDFSSNTSHSTTYAS
jgi:hypothetical protein